LLITYPYDQTEFETQTSIKSCIDCSLIWSIINWASIDLVLTCTSSSLKFFTTFENYFEVSNSI